jgi:hypothetical protein
LRAPETFLRKYRRRVCGTALAGRGSPIPSTTEKSMKSSRVLLGSFAALALSASHAFAAPPNRDACSTGTLAPGVYDGLVVTRTARSTVT